MNFEVPERLRYHQTHEWVDSNGPNAIVGITDFAQEELGDVVFVELPDVGDTLAQGEQFGIIESIKAASDIYTPVAGTVVEINERVFDAPELVNQDPYGEGWLIQLDSEDDSAVDHLLSAREYREQTE